MRARWTISAACAAILSLGACEEEPEPAYLPGPADPAQAERPPERAAERPANTPTDRPADAPTPPAPVAIPAPEDVAAPPAGAERTERGVASRVLEPGTGRVHPGPKDGVTVQYTGWRSETGEMFDSSASRGRPASFTLDRVIPGWSEGLQLMVEGEKRRLWIPGSLAYDGRRGPQGMLVFDVELLEIHPAPEAPEDVSGPPANAERTESGLASRVLEPGQGDRHPAPTDTVEVHYAGWRAEDGELFDTSRTRGEPARFPLNRVIPGWTEGLQLMVEGERRRMWIPANLAYEGRPGAPQGMLVFDVELLRIL